MSNFCGFFGKPPKRPHTVKFSKFCSKVFTVSPIYVVLKFREIDPTGNRQIVHYLPDKKTAASQIVATARITPKICQAQPQQCADTAPDFIQMGFTFSGVIAKCVNTVFCPVKYFHYPPRRYSRRINML